METGTGPQVRQNLSNVKFVGKNLSYVFWILMLLFINFLVVLLHKNGSSIASRAMVNPYVNSELSTKHMEFLQKSQI